MTISVREMVEILRKIMQKYYKSITFFIKITFLLEKSRILGKNL